MTHRGNSRNDCSLAARALPRSTKGDAYCGGTGSNDLGRQARLEVRPSLEERMLGAVCVTIVRSHDARR